jgi:cytochrome c nitrite reductase small subunit
MSLRRAQRRSNLNPMGREIASLCWQYHTGQCRRTTLGLPCRKSGIPVTAPDPPDKFALDLRRAVRGYTIRRMTIVDRVMSVVRLAGLPRPLQVGIYGLVGVALGAGLVVVRIANAASYLSDEPQACINCHVMTDAYASWQRGSHGHAAVCIDCHVPHSSFVAKYAYKAQDGLKHSYVFTRRREPQVLGLSARAVPVVQTNCVRCHDHQVLMIAGVAQPSSAGERIPLEAALERRCWDCHQGIHGKARSLSASPAALRPGLPEAGLDWMKKGDKK